SYGPDHPGLYNAFSNLAEIHVGRREFAQAEAAFQRAIAIGAKVNGVESVTVANVSSRLAAVLTALGRYEEARNLLQTALRIQEQKVGPASLDYASTLQELANLLRKTNDIA